MAALMVEPSTRLYAAAFFRPTSREAIQFEFGRRSRYSLPMTAGMLRPPRQANAAMPLRLELQSLKYSHWARVPLHHARIQSMKLSNQRGWSVLLDDCASHVAIQLPDVGHCLSIIEIAELPELLK
ncbi:unnamed protein product [Protopolystoma xenopodis]|uniref:Uncharacterized protein n=1 Tax=Protopolystoma xenopodis TaxID=117903 RepID=A0A3S5AVS0_9PLAT|nr:unnamed protein product [Protopolystoma xenopodis]